MSSHTAADKAGAAAAAASAPEPLPRWQDDAALQIVGQPVARASAIAKVTGQARYACDITLPGMVHAALVRSSVARGSVTSFDASDARVVPGVLMVLGPSDIAWPKYPPRRRPAVSSEVRFVGEEIGAAVADTEVAARQAARLIRVGYDAMPACITMDQALGIDAPQLADGGNVHNGTQVLECGDLDQARRASEVTIDAHYSTEAQHHNPLEPHGCVADWEGDHLTLWDSNQGAHLIREWLARALDLPLPHVRVISRYVGGGFGSKIHLRPYHLIAAELARRVDRPVRLFMARREEFIASHQRAATRRHIRLGATRAGKLTFIDEDILGQAGPCRFASQDAAGAANGLRLHRVDAVRAEIRRVLTNTQAPIPFRGPTTAEDMFCLEQAVDELAHALQLDPLELRLRNVATLDIFEGLPYSGKQLERCYRLGAERFGWKFRAPATQQCAGKARGIGMGAMAYDATLYEASRAEVACLADGRIEVRVGITEIGGGADTVFAQIAAEELGLPLACVQTHFGDTGSTPRSIDATNHSRTSTVVGPVVRAAAHRLRETLLRTGAALLRVEPTGVSLDQHGISLRDTARVSFADIVESIGAPIVCSADRERPPQGVFAAMFGAHFVEVEVDTRSGCSTVLRAVCAHDAGRVLNPRLAAGQVQGGFLQGMGMALQEERILDPRNGVMLNAAMWAYRTPSIMDAPGSILFVDAGAPDGANSLGVKGIGEPPLIASGAAIANAIYNAIGVRMRSYPITPAKILAALAGAAR